VTPSLETAQPDDRFHDLYRSEFAFVWSAARHLGVPVGAVDDVVQEVFLIAYRRMDALRFEVSARAWLFGVTRRVAFRFRRGAARRARRHAALAEFPRPAGAAPQQRYDDAQQLARVLGKLSPGVRAVWELTEVLGMSAPEIASELGLPLNTVYSRLRLARHQLAEIVADPQALGTWRDATRADQAPPRGAEQRTWAVLLPMFGESGGGVLATATLWVKAKAAMATTLVAGAVVVVGVAGGPTSSARPRERVQASAPVAAAEVALAVAVLEEPAAPPVVPEPALQVMPQKTWPEKQDRSAQLAEEIALIDAANAQLAAGDPGAALSSLAAHARRFPAGMLGDVRDAAQVDALCRRGDVKAAEAAAGRLLQAHAGSAVAQKFADFSCDGDGS
jgi:RNA polymerase sigma factor (sigma-70 family)